MHLDRFSITTGIVALCLILCLMIAGCTSQGQARTQVPDQQPVVTTPQPTPSVATQSTIAAVENRDVADRGLVQDQAVVPAADSTIFGGIIP